MSFVGIFFYFRNTRFTWSWHLKLQRLSTLWLLLVLKAQYINSETTVFFLFSLPSCGFDPFWCLFFKGMNFLFLSHPWIRIEQITFPIFTINELFIFQPIYFEFSSWQPFFFFLCWFLIKCKYVWFYKDTFFYLWWWVTNDSFRIKEENFTILIRLLDNQC